MLGKISGQGARSGIQTSFPYATVATVSDARVILIREYLDHDKALEAVGLSQVSRGSETGAYRGEVPREG